MSEFNESNIILYTLDPEIRSAVSVYLEPWMFQKDIYRAVYEVVINSNFNGEEIDKNVVKLGIEASSYSLQKDDYLTIDELFNSYYEISKNDKKFVIKIISSFIKERLLWRGADLMARKKVDRAESILARAISFSIQERRFTNLSNIEKVLELYESKFPKDGKYLKSTLSLINTNSLFKGYRRGDLVQICAPPKAGKCLAKDTPVLMVDGTIKKVQDIKIGDKLMGPDSKERTVESTTTGMEQMYWIRQNKADDYRVNESHILSLKLSGTDKIYNYSILDYLNLSENTRTKLKGYKSKIEFRNNDHTWNPYLIGLWLADGNSNDTRICINNKDLEIIKELERISVKENLELVSRFNSPNSKLYNLKGNNALFRSKLKEFDLINNKHIPHKYLTSSYNDRLELLAGILDGDGYLNKNKSGESFDIIQKNERVTNNILYLCSSLGFRATKSKCKKKSQTGRYGDYFRITISGDLNNIPNKLGRKKSNLISKRNPLNTGIQVEKDTIDTYYGFTLKEDPLFLLGDFTVTHNTTLMIQETAALAKQGYHVAFVSIGDNEEDDVAMKACAYALGVDIADVVNNFSYYMEKNSDVLDNISAESYPSGSVSIAELLADCTSLHKERPIDVLVVDYDANIMQAADSLYESGGIIYSALKGFAQINSSVVIVGSQPVKTHWELEVLEADSANESSKKAHHVDIMLTLGKNMNCPAVGTVNLALMRRGAGNQQRKVFYNFSQAEIREISFEEYNNLVANKNSQQLTEEVEGLFSDED